MPLASVTRKAASIAPTVTFLHHPTRVAGDFRNDFADLGRVSTNFGLGELNRRAQIDLIQQTVKPRIGIVGPILAQGAGQAFQ